jgi:hypothetical protein
MYKRKGMTDVAITLPKKVKGFLFSEERAKEA